MDPAIAGAIVGALIAGLASGLMAWWSGRRNKRQRQLEAVADFLNNTGRAGEKWTREDRLFSTKLHGRDLFDVMVRDYETFAQVLEVKLHFYGDLRRELEVLDLKVTDKTVRKDVVALESFVETALDTFNEQQSFVFSPTQQKRERLDIGKGDTALQQFLASPITRQFNTLRRAIKETAREHLA